MARANSIKGCFAVALNFPNPNRTYNAKRHCVLFWGYDGAFEIGFMVEQRVFSKINPDAMDGESATLEIFDRYRDKILAVARRIYRGRHAGAYTLAASDF
jgi:hypothetical protein